MISEVQRWGFLGLFVLCIAGCGGDSNLTKVSGTVTMDGEPVGPGTVAFAPVDPTGVLASGNVDEEGKFVMSTSNPGDGVRPGEYRVSITIVKEPAHGDARGNIIPATYLTPERYMNPATSGFTATVEAGKSLDVNYDLKP